MSCIPAAVAVWALVKPRVFGAYIGLAVVGSIIAGLLWGAGGGLIGATGNGPQQLYRKGGLLPRLRPPLTLLAPLIQGQVGLAPMFQSAGAPSVAHIIQAPC